MLKSLWERDRLTTVAAVNSWLPRQHADHVQAPMGSEFPKDSLERTLIVYEWMDGMDVQILYSCSIHDVDGNRAEAPGPPGIQAIATTPAILLKAWTLPMVTPSM